MKTYKLVRQMADGQLAPLFIEATRRLPLGEELTAVSKKVNGYALRPGWHSTPQPDAPHLGQAKGRVWVECEIPDFEYTREEYPELFTGRNGMTVVPTRGWYRWPRPAAQGGVWCISGLITLNRILTLEEVEEVRLLRSLELAA